MTWALNLPERARFRAWQALIVSRFTYGLTFLATVSTQMKDALHTLWYRAFKGLFNIKSNPQKDQFLEQVLGIKGDEYLDLLAKKQTMMLDRAPLDPIVKE